MIPTTLASVAARATAGASPAAKVPAMFDHPSRHRMAPALRHGLYVDVQTTAPAPRSGVGSSSRCFHALVAHTVLAPNVIATDGRRITRALFEVLIPC